MVQPHDPDHGEAHGVCGEGRPLVGELLAEVAVIRRCRDCEHQERDRDREDAVAERFETALTQGRPATLAAAASIASACTMKCNAISGRSASRTSAKPPAPVRGSDTRYLQQDRKSTRLNS